jgi:hypothetical protein
VALASANAPTTAPASPLPTLALATFTSPMHGFSFDYPSDAWRARPATEAWPDGGYMEPEEKWVDSILVKNSALGGLAGIAAKPLASGQTPEAWLDAWVEFRQEKAIACRFQPGAWKETVVGGAAGLRIEAPCSIATGAPFDGPILEAAWVIDGKAYVASGIPLVVEIMLDTFEAP